MIPLSRNTDPMASHRGADHIEKSGQLKSEIEKIHDALKLHPLHTARELSHATKLNYYMIQKRLSVLELRGLARRCGERVCTKSKTGLRVTIWEAV